MATVPLITPTDIVNNYNTLVLRSGVKTAALLDIAQSAVDRIARYLGFTPELDTVSGLPVVTEILNGGRPVIYLLAMPDLVTPAASLIVNELGTILTPRPAFPATIGDYFIGEEGYALYRLNGPGARTLGIWGANSTANIPAGTFGNMTVGGVRQEGDYTANYRSTVTVTYNPVIKLALFRNVALKLCRLDLLDRIALTSVSIGDKSYTYATQPGYQESVDNVLSELPAPIRIGTGN